MKDVVGRGLTVIYEIQSEELIIDVIALGHRKDVYK